MTPRLPAAPPSLPDFRQPQALRAHLRHTLGFYHPRARDPSGGHHQFFKDDGRVYDAHTRHLVSSTRYVFVWAMAARHFPDEPDFLAQARHALQFLRQAHFDATAGHYRWLLRWQPGPGGGAGQVAEVLDGTQHAYGLAFVLLAYAHAVMAGLEEARPWLDETFTLMERRFWQPTLGLYADERSASGVLSPYRGQNANMHATEACLAAFEATGQAHFLDRAAALAEQVVLRQTEQTDGLMIWEHYDAQGRIDWEFNRGDMTNLFRPWGYQPGHFTEWAKLLVLLEAHRPQPWHLPRAEALFERALVRAWDADFGGLHYGFAPDGSLCDDRKYHWVQAETLAAAALLGARTGGEHYWRWYDSLWAYGWRHWVDHEHGAWYRLMARDHGRLTDDKSPAGKVDYHTMGACYDALRALQWRTAQAEAATGSRA